MSKQVVQLKHIGNVIFSQNRQSKNIKVSVKADKSVLVSFPFYVSAREVLVFVEKNEGWIQQQQKKMDLRKTKVEANTEIKSKLHTVKIIQAEQYKIRRKGTEIEIGLPEFESEEASEFIAKHLTEIYRKEAKQLLPVRISQLAEKYGFQFNKVTIRNNRRNWGSCSSRNNISLNLQMMKLPVVLIDYILLHELVHTEIKNHSAKFWERLDDVSGGKARELAKQVKQYSTYTL